MLVLSADRPHELQSGHAPQTIDQVKVFGEHTRASYDLPAPDGTRSWLLGARRLAMQAVATAHDPRPGPVHLNFRARKPLEPKSPEGAEELALVAEVDALLARPIPVPGRSKRAPNEAAVARAQERISGASRGIIVCGPSLPARALERDAIFGLARATGFPVYAEATSQLRYGALPPGAARLAHLDLVIRALPRSALPDLILQVGLPPTFEVLPKLESLGVAPSLVVLSEDDFCDPSGLANDVLFGDIGESCRLLGEGLGEPRPSSFGAIDTKVSDVMRNEVEKGPFAEGTAVRVLVESMGAADTLVVGNSLAVRALDTYTGTGGPAVRVVSQRGASGIDGNVALAAGVSSSLGGRTTLLCGDVTLLHDVGTFIQARALVADLRVVLLNNGGGRIFEQLPIVGVKGLERDVLDLTLTPHSTDFSGIAASAGARHVRVASREALREALSAPPSGLELVEVVLEPSGAILQNRRVWQAIDAAVVTRE
jgi:2-succinyl-5-enolpyruvyl-6-hydroxy-3-cyclohexene-1-carboxylate synthase